MTDRPILFSGSMVRALLAGEKTNTRRVISPDNFRLFLTETGLYKPDPELLQRALLDAKGLRSMGEGSFVWSGPAFDHQLTDITHWQGATVIAPGDRLWVREAHQMANSDGGPVICYRADNDRWQPPFTGPDYGAGPSFDYEKYPGEYSIWAADLESQDHPWRPSIYMPRWCSRITCIVNDVRMERLQDITDDGALCEGVSVAVPARAGQDIDIDGQYWPGGPRRMFRELWNGLNAKRGYGWDVNPWVFVIQDFPMLDSVPSTTGTLAVFSQQTLFWRIVRRDIKPHIVEMRRQPS